MPKGTPYHPNPKIAESIRFFAFSPHYATVSCTAVGCGFLDAGDEFGITPARLDSLPHRIRFSIVFIEIHGNLIHFPERYHLLDTDAAARIQDVFAQLDMRVTRKENIGKEAVRRRLREFAEESQETHSRGRSEVSIDFTPNVQRTRIVGSSTTDRSIS